MDQRLSRGAKVYVKSHRDSVECNPNKKCRDENFNRGIRLQAQTASPSRSLRTSERVEKRKEAKPFLINEPKLLNIKFEALFCNFIC